MNVTSLFVLVFAVVAGSSALAAPLAPNQAPVQRVERLSAAQMIVYYDIATADGPSVVIRGLDVVVDHCIKSAMMAMAEPQSFVFGFGLQNRPGLIEQGRRLSLFEAGDKGGCWVARKKAPLDNGETPAI